MIRTVLVPLDGSSFGERALPMATFLARAMDARLVLTRAVWVAFAPGLDPTEAAEVHASQEAEKYLVGIADQLAGQGFPVEVAAPYISASPTDGILLEIDLRRADLVVMCTHGRSGLGRWIYGSVAEGVLARSPVPILLIQATGPMTMLTTGADPLRVLVPLDGSDFAEAVLPHATMLAQALDADVVLVRVVVRPVAALTAFVPPVPEISAVQSVQAEMVAETELREAKKYLIGLAERLACDGVRVQTIARIGVPAETILEEAKSAHAGLIAMATHGRTGLERLLLGSVALEVLRRGLLPLLLMHPTGLAATAA